MVRVWATHGERGAWTYNEGLGAQLLAGSGGSSPGQQVRERSPPEAESFFWICTTSGVGQFVLKSVFKLQNKKFRRTLGGMAPWIRQCITRNKRLIGKEMKTADVVVTTTETRAATCQICLIYLVVSIWHIYRISNMSRGRTAGRHAYVIRLLMARARLVHITLPIRMRPPDWYTSCLQTDRRTGLLLVNHCDNGHKLIKVKG